MRGKHAKPSPASINSRKIAVVAGLGIGTLAVPVLPIAAYASTAPAASGYRGPLAVNHVTQAFHNPDAGYGLGYHTGVDLRAAEGDSVHSAGPGVVAAVGGAGAAYGNHVVVHHTDGKFTLYAHLSSISVSVGQNVTGATEVGKAGHTGNASGPHLHFEVRNDPAAYEDGVFSDPVTWLAGHGVTLEGATTPVTPKVVTPKVVTPKVVTPPKPSTAVAGKYTVVSGDNLYDIAIAKHVGDGGPDTWKPLYEANRAVVGANPNLIYPGQSLVIPGAKVEPAQPVAARHWENCTDAKSHGWHDFRRVSSGYEPRLDRDHDGIACETTHHVAAPSTPAPSTTPPPPAPPAATGFTPVLAPDGPGTPSGYVAHSPSYWIPLIQQAMTLVGGGVAQGNQVNAVVNRITIESSGDPNAINLTDSNATQLGDPSRGLMQTINATFQANHLAGTSTNIYDPLANICAALKYINAQYGGIVPTSSTY